MISLTSRVQARWLTTGQSFLRANFDNFRSNEGWFAVHFDLIFLICQNIIRFLLSYRALNDREIFIIFKRQLLAVIADNWHDISPTISRQWTLISPLGHNIIIVRSNVQVLGAIEIVFILRSNVHQTEPSSIFRRSFYINAPIPMKHFWK